jgi:hypothetical protein
MMSRLLAKENWLEALAALLTLGIIIAVLQSFIIGKHFVIPTMFLVLAVFLGNVVRFGLLGKAWAKHILFWIFAIFACHLFFALFWAGSARPGEFLGSAFYPVYGGLFLLITFTCSQYAKKNNLP